MHGRLGCPQASLLMEYMHLLQEKRPAQCDCYTVTAGAATIQPLYPIIPFKPKRSNAVRTHAVLPFSLASNGLALLVAS